MLSPEFTSKKLAEQFPFPRREDAGFQRETPSQNITNSVKFKSCDQHKSLRRVCATETKVVKNFVKKWISPVTHFFSVSVEA